MIWSPTGWYDLLSESETKTREDGMRARSGSLSTAARKFWGSPTFAAAAGAALLLVGNPASAQAQAAGDPPALRLIKIIPINGTAGSPNTKLFSFDISWVDQGTGLYYLADRSNKALDVVDTTGAHTGTADTLFGQIGGSAFNFAGDTGNSGTSGPNGVVAGTGVGSTVNCIFATDTGSPPAGRVVSINSNVSFVTPTSSVSTGGTHRADELAYDPADGLLLVINNADTPAFGTLIAVNKSTCALTVGTQIIFDAAHTFNATNGAEQPVWDRTTQRFYVSIPEINGPGDGTGPLGTGAVARITTSGVVEALYPINFCSPAGLTVGPSAIGDLLVGCNTIYDLAGTKCSNLVPAPNPTTGTAAQTVPAHPTTCTGVAYPQSAICNPGRGCTPANGSLLSVPGAGGGDEVWFNSGDGNYYVTAGNNPPGPSFAVIASGVNTPANTLTQLIPTLPPVPLLPGPPPTFTPVHSAGTVHSIAASATNNHVYVPLPANTDYSDSSGNNCAQGCIAVFSAQ
jgi:hypothetical protein